MTTPESDIFAELETVVATWNAKVGGAYGQLSETIEHTKTKLDVIGRVLGTKRTLSTSLVVARARMDALDQAPEERAASVAAAIERIKGIEKFLSAYHVELQTLHAQTERAIRAGERLGADLLRLHDEDDSALVTVEEGDHPEYTPPAAPTGPAISDQEKMLAGKVEGLEVELNDARDELTAANAQVGNAEQDIRSQKEALSKRVEKADSSLQEAEAQLKTAQADLESAREDAAQAQERASQLDEANQELETLRDDLATKDAEIAGKGTELAELGAKLNEEIDGLREALDTANARLEAAQAEQDQELSAHSNIEEELAAARRGLEEVQAALEEQGVGHAAREAEFTGQRDDLEAKLSEAHAQREEADARASENESHREQVEDLASEVERLTQELADARSTGAVGRVEASDASAAETTESPSRTDEDESETSEEPEEASFEELQDHSHTDQGKRQPMGEILVSAGVITGEQLSLALSEQKTAWQRHLGAILVDLEFTTEETIAKTLAAQAQFSFVQLADQEISSEALALVPAKLARFHTCIPIQLDGGSLAVAIANPLDLVAVEDLRIATSRHIDLSVAAADEIRQAIRKHYG